jgi:hypothetical protein
MVQAEFMIGFFAGMWLFFNGFLWLQQKRMIENTPTSKIRSLAMGNVEVYGEVLPQKKMLKSPLLGKDCVYYDYRIQEEMHARDYTYWATIKKGQKAVEFMLRDSTGEVLVNTKGAKIEIPGEYEYLPQSGKIPERMIKYFIRNDIRYKGLFGFNRQLRIVERNIEPKDKLYIMGTAGDNPYVEDTTAQKNEEDIMIQKGGVGTIYYISDRPEKEILKKLNWKVLGGLLGGSVLTLGCLAIILFEIGLF